MVKLSLRPLESDPVVDTGYGRALELVVRDTGKGISGHYLRTRLFTPFAQENTLAPGVGYAPTSGFGGSLLLTGS